MDLSCNKYLFNDIQVFIHKGHYVERDFLRKLVEMVYKNGNRSIKIYFTIAHHPQHKYIPVDNFTERWPIYTSSIILT